jgi:hypothetical protein
MYSSLCSPDHSFERGFCLLARTGHQGLVIFPGQKIGNKFRDRRITAAEHRFRVARTILKLKPHESGTTGLSERLLDSR